MPRRNSSARRARRKRFACRAAFSQPPCCFFSCMLAAEQAPTDISRSGLGRTVMTLHQANIESLPFVTGELNYLAPTPGKPRTYAFDPPPGEPKSTALPEPHHVPIFDGRLIAKGFSLDREGFELVRHPTAVKNFYEEAEIKRVYYPAVEGFM